MKLFYLKGACSLAPHILFNELELPLELIKLDKSDKTEIQKYNPKGLVPTLVLDDGKVLTETAVILQYLADLKPERKLLPATGWERYKVLEWLNYVATELHKGTGILFRKDLSSETREVLKSMVVNRLNFVEENLQQREYLGERGFSIADIYAYVVLTWNGYVGIDMGPYPKIAGYIERIQSRPATVKSIRSER